MSVASEGYENFPVLNCALRTIHEESESLGSATKHNGAPSREHSEARLALKIRVNKRSLFLPDALR